MGCIVAEDDWIATVDGASRASRTVAATTTGWDSWPALTWSQAPVQSLLQTWAREEKLPGHGARVTSLVVAPATEGEGLLISA